MYQQLFNEYKLLDHGVHFTYEINDEKTREIKNICRFVSGGIKYLFESIKDLPDLVEPFKNMDLKLSKPILFYLRFLLKQNTDALKDNECYINMFYRLMTLMAKNELGNDIFERIRNEKRDTLPDTVKTGCNS